MQKQQRTIERQFSAIDEQRQVIAALSQRLDRLETRLASASEVGER